MDPPLGAYGEHATCWDVVRDDLFQGAFAEWLRTPYYVGEIDGEVAGYMACFTATGKPEVGLVEFVNTADAHRRKRVSTALLRHLIARFEADGGRALYLCTTNPIAGQLYENCGFDYLVGDGMRYLSPEAGDFGVEYFAYTGTASSRPAHWGDLPGSSALFCHPEPTWEIKEYLSDCFRNTRFEGHFMRLMRRVEEDRGLIEVLENTRGRVMGCVIIERQNTYHQQHVAQLSLRVAPAYAAQCGNLLDAAAKRAHAIGISVLQTYVAEGDTDASNTFAGAGFVQEAVLQNRLRTESGFTNIVMLSRISDEVAPHRPQQDFYGERCTWQTERISERQSAKST